LLPIAESRSLKDNKLDGGLQKRFHRALKESKAGLAVLVVEIAVFDSLLGSSSLPVRGMYHQNLLLAALLFHSDS